MPRGHGRTVFIADKAAERRSFALSRRSSARNAHNLASKENLVVVPVLRNCEERRVVLRLLTLDVHLLRLLVPFTSFIEGPEIRNEQGFQNPVNADMLNSPNSCYPQPTIFIQLDLQKERFPNSQENSAITSAFTQTVSDCKSSTPNVCERPQRLTNNEPIKNTFKNMLVTAAPESTQAKYISDYIASNASDDATIKIDQLGKQSTRKKGKKKRKQYKRSMDRKTVKSEKQGDELDCNASKSGTSTSGDVVCSATHENSLSLVLTCSRFPVKDTSSEVMGQMDIECSGKDYLGTLSCSPREPLQKTINGSRKPFTLSSEFSEDDIDTMPFEAAASSSNKACETKLLTVLQKNSEIEMMEDSVNDCRTEWCEANDGRFNPLADMMTSISSNISVQSELEDHSNHDSNLSSNGCINYYDLQKDVTDNDCSSERVLTSSQASSSDLQKDVADTDCSSERLLGSGQASSSDDFHPVIRGKRGRLARKLSGSLEGVHRPNNTYVHRSSETDNKRSVWKKVEKESMSESAFPRTNVKIASQNVGMSLKCIETGARQYSKLNENRSGKSFRYSSSGVVDSSQSYSSILSSFVETNSGNISLDRSTYLEKLQKKPNLASEPENLPALQTNINNIISPFKIEALRMEKSSTEANFTDISQLASGMNSSLKLTKNSPNILQNETGTNNICSLPLNASSLSQNISTNSSVIVSNSDQNYSSKEFHSTAQTLDINNDPCNIASVENINCKRVERKSGQVESSGSGNSSGSLLQQFVPTQRKDLSITRSQYNVQAYSMVCGPAQTSLNSTAIDEFSKSNSHTSACFPARETQCSSPSTSCMDCTCPEEDEIINELDSQPFTLSEESRDCTSSDFCFSQKTTESLFEACETDLTKIIEAVDTSYKLLVADEVVQLTMDSTVSGFEKILHSASPVIEIGCISMCNICCQNQIIGDSLCIHQVPNISLRRLWQWYEKPGSYGLEVKVHDLHAPKRSRTGLHKFCAYFVPYLSAVQLFARSGKPDFNPNNDTVEDSRKTYKVCGTFKCSASLASLPIFSKLLPQSSKKEDTLSSSKGEEFNKPVFKEQLAGELLFEYFESDQPQQRRPLFEKINELIHGDSLSKCHHYGESSKLECLNLNELHPSSWYAVAWYPIYRIPEGNFRAAFLTYHSFGRIVCRSTTSSADCCINTLISPVVGLQSYNAQGECWFDPTGRNSDAIEKFKGRLQSLERAASAMSRATVRRGALSCTNKHPDFEFFLSRKR